MSLPSGVAVSSEGGVYVSDSGNHRIRYVSAVGKVSSVAGSGNAGFADGSLSRSKFNDPQAIVLTSDGNLFIADSKNHRIRLIDFEKGLVHTYAGAGIGDYRDAPDATQAYIRSPLGLAYQEQTRDLFFTDGDNRVRVVRALGGVETLLNGAGKTGYVDAAGLAAVFNSPSHMTFNDDESVLYVADRRNNRIRSVDMLSLAVTTVAGTEAAPDGLGTLSSDGSVLGNPLPGSPDEVRFNHPFGIAFYREPRDVGDPFGNSSLPGRSALLVTELRSHRLRRIILDGNVSGSPDFSVASFPYAGSYASASGHADDLGPACLFDVPSGVAVFPNTGGQIAFVADAKNHALRRVSREMPTKLRISVSALDSSLLESRNEAGYARDAVLDSYGYYSINGAPNNETTHAHGSLSYSDESHDLAMCAYPRAEYFFHFKGAIQAAVSEEEKETGSGRIFGSYTYIAWAGRSATDERSENLRLRGGGCTDPNSPNFNAWAIYDDGSCVSGVAIEVLVKARGKWGAYQIEGPGMYYYDELVPLSTEFDEDDVHLVKLVTWPQAIYTVQVHGAVSVLMADSVGQTTLFTYLNYTSDEDDAHHIDAIRPAGAGCTQSAFVNYSPFATREDDSCIEGSQIQIESTPSVGGGLADWYGNGLIAILQPLLLGGHTLLNPALFSSSNGILIQRAYVAPGKYPIHVFGRASSQVLLGEGGDILVNVDGSNEAQHIDTHGFSSTLGDAMMHFTVPESTTQQQVVSNTGGVVGSSQSGTITLGSGALQSPTVIGISVSDMVGSNLRNDGSSQGTWDVISKTFQVNPLRLQLVSPASISIPFDDANQPTLYGNSEKAVLSASDERGLDWKVVPGATFTSDNAFFEIDHFSMLTVIARAEVRSVSPVNSRICGGSSITLDGVNLRAVPIPSASASGSLFCKFGELYQKAEFIESRELRGFGEAVLCTTPCVTKAGFTSVEVHDASTLLSSASGLRILLSAPASVNAIAPPSGPGNSLAVIFGNRLSAAVTNLVISRVGDSGGCSTRLYDEVFCNYGDSSLASNGYAISSAVGICEVPDQNVLLSIDDEVFVTLSADAHSHPLSAAVYKYRAALLDSPLATSAHLHEGERISGSFYGGTVVSIDFMTSRHNVPESTTDQYPSSLLDLRCIFGTVSVKSRASVRPGLGLHCVSPAISSIESVNGSLNHSTSISTLFVAGAPGEPAVHVANVEHLPDARSLAVSPVSVTLKDNDSTAVHLFTYNDAPISISLWNRTSFACATSYGSSFSTEHQIGASHVRLSVQCLPTAVKHGGFTVISVHFDRLDSHILTDITPVDQLLSRGESESAFVASVAGGTTVSDGTGGIIRMSGRNMLPTGVGGSWSSDDVLGFGWGTESRLSCRYLTSLGDDVLQRDHILTSATDGYFVSSALVICEPPSQVFSRDSSLNRIARYAYSDLGLEVMATITSGLTFKTTDALYIALNLIPEPILTSVSPQSELPPDGGGIVKIAWQYSTFESGRERDLRAILRPSCAFGSIAPVSMSIDGRDIKSGRCVTPAETIAVRYGTSFVDQQSPLDISLHLPNTGRLSAGTGTRFVTNKTVRAVSTSIIMPSTSASMGAPKSLFVMFSVSSQVAKNCNFVGYESATVLHPFSRNFAACVSPVLPGGFVVVELTDWVVPDYVTGAKQQIEIYSSPFATSLMPSNAPSGGGTIISVVGVDLLPSCGDGVNSLPDLQCLFGAHSTKAATIVSSVLARCEVPPQARTTHVWPETESLQSTQTMESIVDYPFAAAREGDTLARMGLSLQFMTPPTAIKVFPSVVSADRGGTVVAVYGRNFREEVHLGRCVFGTIQVTATVRNSTQLECSSPTHVAATVPLAVVYIGVWGLYDLAFDFI